MAETKEVPVHPVQTHYRPGQQGWCPQAVTMRAYEVYCHLYGRQQALVEGGCRGGFGVGELVAFLYARSFPKEEWRVRVDEAFRGMSGLS
jgi:hypothetical protein